jgi:hypothetical protein
MKTIARLEKGTTHIYPDVVGEPWWFIKVTDTQYELYEIPQYGGKPMLESVETDITKLATLIQYAEETII